MQLKLATFVSVVLFVTAGAGAAEPPVAAAHPQFLKLSFSDRIEVGAYLLEFSNEQRRENAVSMARSGQLDTAARTLTVLQHNAPGNDRVLFDLISVLNWQGSHAQVTELAGRLKPGATPVYALEAVASSARKNADFEAAISWYSLALQKEPGSTELLTGLAFSQADGGDAAAAQATYQRLPVAYRDSVTGLLADAYLARSRGDQTRALMAYEQVLAKDADNAEALRGKLRTLRDLLLVDQAIDFATRFPAATTRAETDALYVDRAALWIRWGAEPVTQGPRRFEDLDRALSLLQDNLQRFPADSELGKTTRFDRIAALHLRGRHADVVTAYESLNTPDALIPAYALRAVAGSRLARREPLEALRLYDLALRESPEDFELRLDRFFALVELERHGEARALADELVFSQDIWRTVPGSRVVKPNPRRLKAEITRALSRAYADDLVRAQSYLADMLAEAPHNTDVRQELANVYRWRGWPRRALNEYLQVYTVEEQLLSARIGLANSLLDLNMGQEFESLFAELEEAHGDNAGVRRLVRRRDLHRRHELSVTGSGGTSTGEQFGSRQHLAEARWLVGGFGYRWRPLLHLHDSRAEFSDGNAKRRRAGLGLQYRLPNHTLEASASASVEGAARTGLSVAYGWAPGDRWQLDGLLETDSLALPLRAYRDGTSADRIRLGATYRHSELGQIRVAAEAMDFSDGNLRQSILLDTRRRLLNYPRFKFDVVAGAYASRNDLSNVAYFSPSSDRSVNLGGDARWRLFRRYERNFDQQLIVNIGRYNQSGFAGGTVASAELRQIFQLSAALELFFGVRRARALYDGGFEYGTFYQGGLRGRF